MGGVHSAVSDRLPAHDTGHHIKQRLSILSRSRDRFYHLAYKEYVAAAQVNDFRIVDDIIDATPPQHQIVIRGDVYDRRYMVVRRIAVTQHISTWVAVDLNTYTTRTRPTCEHVLLKFARAEIHCSREIRREIELKGAVLRALDHALIPLMHSPIHRIFRSFKLVGRGGQYVCLVAERMRGDDLHTLIGMGRTHALPIVTVRLIARDLLRALDLLHRECHLVHTHVSPESVFIAASDDALARGQYRDLFGREPCLQAGFEFPLPVVKLGDLGHASHVASPTVLVPVGSVNYRAPEVLLGMHYDTQFDMWSLACTLFEAMTGTKLFDPSEFEDQGMNESEALISAITETLGPLPDSMSDLPMAKVYCDQKRRSRARPNLHDDPRRIRRRLETLHGFRNDDAAMVEAFLLPMLEIDPSRRPEASSMLSHPWLEPVVLASI